MSHSVNGKKPPRRGSQGNSTPSRSSPRNHRSSAMISTSTSQSPSLAITPQPTTNTDPLTSVPVSVMPQVMIHLDGMAKPLPERTAELLQRLGPSGFTISSSTTDKNPKITQELDPEEKTRGRRRSTNRDKQEKNVHDESDLPHKKKRDASPHNISIPHDHKTSSLPVPTLRLRLTDYTFDIQKALIREDVRLFTRLCHNPETKAEQLEKLIANGKTETIYHILCILNLDNSQLSQEAKDTVNTSLSKRLHEVEHYFTNNLKHSFLRIVSHPQFKPSSVKGVLDQIQSDASTVEYLSVLSDLFQGVQATLLSQDSKSQAMTMLTDRIKSVAGNVTNDPSFLYTQSANQYGLIERTPIEHNIFSVVQNHPVLLTQNKKVQDAFMEILGDTTEQANVLLKAIFKMADPDNGYSSKQVGDFFKDAELPNIITYLQPEIKDINSFQRTINRLHPDNAAQLLKFFDESLCYSQEQEKHCKDIILQETRKRISCITTTALKHSDKAYGTDELIKLREQFKAFCEVQPRLLFEMDHHTPFDQGMENPFQLPPERATNNPLVKLMLQSREDSSTLIKEVWEDHLEDHQKNQYSRLPAVQFLFRQLKCENLLTHPETASDSSKVAREDNKSTKPD